MFNPYILFYSLTSDYTWDRDWTVSEELLQPTTFSGWCFENGRTVQYEIDPDEAVTETLMGSRELVSLTYLV
jgi:hypothetical protein